MAKKTHRLNLVLDAKAKKQLDVLLETSKSSTITEVFRKALAMYSLISELLTNGGKVVFRNADGTEETIKFS